MKTFCLLLLCLIGGLAVQASENDHDENVATTNARRALIGKLKRLLATKTEANSNGNANEPVKKETIFISDAFVYIPEGGACYLPDDTYGSYDYSYSSYDNSYSSYGNSYSSYGNSYGSYGNSYGSYGNSYGSYDYGYDPFDYSDNFWDSYYSYYDYNYGSPHYDDYSYWYYVYNDFFDSYDNSYGSYDNSYGSYDHSYGSYDYGYDPFDYSDNFWDSYYSYHDYNYGSPHYSAMMDPATSWYGYTCGDNFWYDSALLMCSWKYACGQNTWPSYKRGLKRATEKQIEMRRELVQGIAEKRKKSLDTNENEENKRTAGKKIPKETAKRAMLHRRRLAAVKKMEERRKLKAARMRAERKNGNAERKEGGVHERRGRPHVRGRSRHAFLERLARMKKEE